MDKEPQKIIQITEAWLKKQTNLPEQVITLINTGLIIERDINGISKRDRYYYD